MIKKTLSILLFLACSLLSSAQFRQVAEGPVFDVPTGGFSKLLQMKDGSLIYFYIAFKDERIDISIYDPAHRQISSTELKPAYGKLKSSGLQGLFEINGDAVLFISEVQDKVPVLYRLIIDGKKGTLKKEEKIAELKKLNAGMGYAMALGGVGIPDFTVSKDLDSDNYAIALFNSFESDRNKRIEIVLYGSDHNELSRAYYASPDEKYKYLYFVSMAVMGSEKVSVLVKGYDSEKKDMTVILASLKKGASAVSFNEIYFPKDSIMETGLVQYNPVIKKFIVLAKMYSKGGSKEANMYIGVVDTHSEKMEKLVVTGISEKIADKGKDIFGKKFRYAGIPKLLQIRPGGDFSIVYESMGTQTTFNSSAYAGGTYSDIKTGSIVVARYSRNCEFINDYLIPKDFTLYDPNVVFRSISFRNEYKKFTFINSGEKEFLFFNDTEKNIDRLEKNKEPVTLEADGDCDAFYFPITGDDPIPQRKFLAEDGGKKGNETRALFGLSAYDPKNNLFIVVCREKNGRNKGFKLKWLQPQ